MAEPREELNEDQENVIAATVAEWAAATPERTVLIMMDGPEISSLDIVESLSVREGPVYQHIMNISAVGLRDESLDLILGDFLPQQGLFT